MTAFAGGSVPELTREQIRRYARATSDFNPMHLDEEYARRAGMRSVIAHGPLTLARGLDLIVAQLGAGAFRGLDARFKAPYHPGESLVMTPTESGLELHTGAGTLLVAASLTLTEPR